MSAERQSNDTNNPWWGEHLHRYEVALTLIEKTQAQILDIACGTGFGSDYLAASGHQVIGGDISAASIAQCQASYKRTNLSFQLMDATQIHFPDAHFDVIVSFETIEHTTAFHQVLQEFKRVLKPDGRLILSTPNVLINSPNGQLVNPYHTQEWQYEALKQLLQIYFEQVNLKGQHYRRYTQQNSLKNNIAKVVESVLYKRGVRKIPLQWQDKLMQWINGTPMYPRSCDYEMITEPNEVITCKTFFAVCALSAVS